LTSNKILIILIYSICSDQGVSNFWKVILWAAGVAKMGYRWRVGRGDALRFWEDTWIVSFSLAIQYWELYVIVNEKSSIVAELWDEENIRCTFCRCVDERLYLMWLELVNLLSTVSLT
jgi:hypothetical protein